MKLIDRVYGDYVAIRRTRVFSDHLVKIISNRFLMVDVSCGDRFGCLFDRSLHVVARLEVQHSQRPRNRLMT
jgi:hypothetical protein